MGKRVGFRRADSHHSVVSVKILNPITKSLWILVGRMKDRNGKSTANLVEMMFESLEELGRMWQGN